MGVAGFELSSSNPSLPWLVVSSFSPWWPRRRLLEAADGAAMVLASKMGPQGRCGGVSMIREERNVGNARLGDEPEYKCPVALVLGHFAHSPTRFLRLLVRKLYDQHVGALMVYCYC